MDSPKCNRLNRWDYNEKLHKKCSEVERLSRMLRGFLRIFSRFDKLDVVFIAFIHITLIVDELRIV